MWKQSVIKRLANRVDMSCSCLFWTSPAFPTLMTQNVHQWFINLSATWWLWCSASSNAWEMWLSTEAQLEKFIFNLEIKVTSSMRVRALKKQYLGCFVLFFTLKNNKETLWKCSQGHEWGLRLFGPSFIRQLKWSQGPSWCWQEVRF